MNYSIVMQVILLAIIVLVLQIFIPVIHINGLEMTPDILIIFLTYIGTNPLYFGGHFENSTSCINTPRSFQKYSFGMYVSFGDVYIMHTKKWFLVFL